MRTLFESKMKGSEVAPTVKAGLEPIMVLVRLSS